MSDFLKKGFLLGLGAALTGKEKLEQKLQELVDKGELSQDQARSVLKNFTEKGEWKTEEWNAKREEQMRELANDLGLATKEDISKMEARIAELETKREDER
ncbi:phasin family protein [Lentibacillus juripiscarius]|uniref:Phasin family protein n=1 Tax=Lentibacillus juripiscarius TaxID=257446 RepID=A0ABW5V7W0_9BACI